MNKKVLVKIVASLLVFSITLTGFPLSFIHHELFETVVLADENSKNSSNEKVVKPVVVTNNDLIINGKKVNEEELKALLDKKMPSLSRIGGLATVYFIPGVGEVALTVTGVIILGGVTIGAGHWAYKTIKNYFKEHTKNKRKSTYNKHTKPRPGRQNEKKKQKPGWQKRR
ncbi:hypothetical protein [Enterococcus sp. DIV1420a]|uniref:hypothetical protein n=1 Tax=Enterococcus sp. DIV1420a TaxID=2774672 RepID=UPI003F288BDD